MRKKFVAGNWKMNGNLDSISHLTQALPGSLDNSQAACVVFPPSIYIPYVSEHLVETSLRWGAQNVYPAEAGAYTGELSASMLKDFGCEYVLVGHSERRQLFAESEKFVAEKFHHVKDHGMIPVLCIGETLAEREQGITEPVLVKQLKAVALSNPQAFNQCVIAYEPVWAIGTGQTATPEQVQAAHSAVRTIISELGEVKGKDVSIVYGGSVNETNAKALFSMPDVDGGLIGGASLNARQFVEIVQCINSY